MSENKSTLPSGKGTAEIKIIFAAVTWGTIGLFIRYISAPSSFVACLRGFIGALFLFLLLKIRKQSLNIKAINENLKLLILSGIALGFNWILLFEAYKRTSLSIASLCYYLAPVIVVVVSHFFFKERLSLPKTVCIVVTLLGMVLISGLLQDNIGNGYGITGMLCGIGAAILYASVALMGKKIKGIPAFDETIVQLLVAAIVLIPYNLLTVPPKDINLDMRALLLILLLGIVHTGLAFMSYFSSLQTLNAQAVAVLSYIDPVVSILISIFILNEQMDILSLVGAVLVIGSLIAYEFLNKRSQ